MGADGCVYGFTCVEGAEPCFVGGEFLTLSDPDGRLSPYLASCDDHRCEAVEPTVGEAALARQPELMAETTAAPEVAPVGAPAVGLRGGAEVVVAVEAEGLAPGAAVARHRAVERREPAAEVLGEGRPAVPCLDRLEDQERRHAVLAAVDKSQLDEASREQAETLRSRLSTDRVATAIAVALGVGYLIIIVLL